MAGGYLIVPFHILVNFESYDFSGSFPQALMLEMWEGPNILYEFLIASVDKRCVLPSL